jgi:hypothetical protein
MNTGPRSETMSTKQLSSYLKDHLTDETLALDLARRAAVEHEGARFGTFFETPQLGARGGP